MTKPKVLFRADGNSQIGMGHFVRTLALADMLSEEFECHFAIAQPTSGQKAQIGQICKSCITLSGGEAHFEEFLGLISGEEIVVLDNYYFDVNYQRRIKSRGARLVCIDDIADRDFVADLIINHAPGVESDQYRAEPYTQYALGAEYALLRPTFLKAANSSAQWSAQPQHQKAFICFGGADPQDLTSLAISLLLRREEVKEIHAVVGSQTKAEELREKFEERSLGALHFHTGLSEAEMHQMLLEADFAVVPSSSLLYEVLATKKLVISGYFTENQRSIYEGFRKFGIFVDAQGFSQTPLSKAFDSLWEMEGQEVEALLSNQGNVIDGLSKKRIIKLFQEL